MTPKGIEAFEKTKRLMVVAAHADDLETMCGGTIALLVARGVEVISVNCTLGDIGIQDPTVARLALAARRLAETEAAARCLGIRQTYNLNYPDGELEATLALRAQLARLYRITQVDTLWTFDPFWPGQIHPDHRAAGLAALDAFMPSKMPLYYPEQLNEPGAGLGRLEQVFLFATDREPNVFVDVTAVYETKLAACMLHHSQFPKGEEDLTWMKDIDQKHGETIGVTYAESFRPVEIW